MNAKKRKEELPRTEDYVERFISGVAVGNTPNGYFIIDLLKPEGSFLTTSDEKSKISGFRGKLKTDVRLFTSPQIVKKLLTILQKTNEEIRTEIWEKTLKRLKCLQKNSWIRRLS